VASGKKAERQKLGQQIWFLKRGRTTPHLFSDLFILRGFKSNVLELFIPKGLQRDFTELMILRGLAGLGRLFTAYCSTIVTKMQ
jgi:hypothetical protein